MTDVIARIKIKGKNYETLVDVDKALQLKQGKPVAAANVVAMDDIFYDCKKGLRVSEADLQTAFGTSDPMEAAIKIIKSGEIQIPKEYRDTERENKKKQLVDFFVKNSVDPRTNMPHTPDRISAALDEAGINIENKPIEQQLSRIIQKLKEKLPLKIKTKKLKIRIPAEHTGRVYGLITDFKETEEWLPNGDLETTINLPAGLQDEFYDKLNSVTHGSAITQEIKVE